MLDRHAMFSLGDQLVGTASAVVRLLPPLRKLGHVAWDSDGGDDADGDGGEDGEHAAKKKKAEAHQGTRQR